MKTEYSVSVNRLVHASRARVFDAFSNAQALSQWFSPAADITLEVEVFEFFAGGQFRLRYTMPDGTQPVVGGVYEHIEPQSRIIFSWQWQQPDPHSDIPTRVDVRFEERGDDTVITVTHERLPSEEAGERHQAGWEGTFDSLERFVASGGRDTPATARETGHA